MDLHGLPICDPATAAVANLPDPDQAKFAKGENANFVRRSSRVTKAPDRYRPLIGTESDTKSHTDRDLSPGTTKGTAASQKRHVAHRRASSGRPALAKVASGGVSKRTRVSSKGLTCSAGRLNTPPDSPAPESLERPLTPPVNPSSPVLHTSSSSTDQNSGSLYCESNVQEDSTQGTQLSASVHSSEHLAQDQHALVPETEHFSADADNDMSAMETEGTSLTVPDQAPVISNGDSGSDGAVLMDIDPVTDEAPMVSNGDAGADGAVPMNNDPVSAQEGERAPAVGLPKLPDLKKITMEMAELMSHPSPGDKLLMLVEIAKEEGLLRKGYDSAVVRHVYGEFLVPQKCYGCIAANEFCDRSAVCHTCHIKGQPCERQQSGFLVPATPKTKFIPPNMDGVHRNVRAIDVIPTTRPEPVGQPKVWAESRTALCETLQYFRAFQSAAYLNDGLCWALLVDRQGSDRDIITDNVVITRCGGGMSRVDGEMAQTSDQTSESTVVKALTRNLSQKVPTILIVGNGNPNCPSRVPHRYCVMDYFHITKIWCEKAGTKNCFMFRFEKVFQEVRSWWSPSTMVPGPPAIHSEIPVYATCTFCEKDEVQIYTEGWMCLNEECRVLWTIGLAAPRLPLRHTSYFLNHKVGFDWKNIKPPCQIVPDLISPARNASYAVSRSCWRGIVCRRCGRCTPRVDWSEWKCQTPGCGYTYTIPLTPLEVREVTDPHGVISYGHAAPTTLFMEPITCTYRLTNNYRINTYTIPGRGTITHFQANLKINERQGGPNDMFYDLQRMNLGLKRYPLSNSQLPGALTAHFAVNYGMPYKYVVAVDSKGFREAPKEILRALHRLTWAGEQSVTDGSFNKFNELLTVGYFEEQKMGYHDDGESTLGPTIASMSLGGEATMTFRLKKPYWTPFNRNGTYKYTEEPLPGCKNYAKRKEIYDNVHTYSPEHIEELVEEIRKDSTGFSNPAIKTILRHGDLLVMHGADIQKYYEHSVHSSGRLRFALTCRYVKPELIPEDQHWKGEYASDEDYRYDGDENHSDVTMSPDNGWGWADPWAPQPLSSIDGSPSSN